MDKKVIFAVAGSGKTTYIVNSLSTDKRSIIVTYTIANHENLRGKIIEKFNGKWPENVTLMSFFSFLYRFCYKPFLADAIKAKGITYDPNKNLRIPQTQDAYFITKSGYLYSNRLSLFLQSNNVIDDIKERLCKYFDEFIIDEVQDIAGRDFTFLESLMETDIAQLYVGDFYQHTFDTSRDGNVNGKLFDDRSKYMKRFTDKGFDCDTSTLLKSWRCGSAICKYISDNLGIEIESHRDYNDNSSINFIDDSREIDSILGNAGIIKLHYQKGATYGAYHRNWGETKGEDQYQDVCVMLNKNTAKLHATGKMKDLPPSTRNKLYVAITRAHGNVYLINE